MKSREEYKRLIHLLEAGNLEKLNLQDILKEAVKFFDQLRQDFPSASKEDREEMIHMMSHMHSKLQEVSQKAIKEAGLKEDEIESFSQNPENFSPDQWREVQESRQKLADSARKFTSTMSSTVGPKGVENKEHKKGKKPPSTGRRTKRQDWTKS